MLFVLNIKKRDELYDNVAATMLFMVWVGQRGRTERVEWGGVERSRFQ